MPRISTDNYDTVASWNGSQDLFVVEQPDSTKVATPAMVKQFMQAGDFTATGEVKDGNGNILSNIAGQVSDLNNEIGAIGELKTWTPQIYDLDTFKRNAAAQSYIKIGKLYVMFMEGTFDFSGITTILEIRNLPCQYCVNGAIFLGNLKTAVQNDVGNTVQGSGNIALIRPNVVSTDFNGDPASAPRNKFVFFGYDA